MSCLGLTPRQASNGEEIHGYLWQSLRLKANIYESMDAPRKATKDIDEATGEDHAMFASMLC